MQRSCQNIKHPLAEFLCSVNAPPDGHVEVAASGVDETAPIEDSSSNSNNSSEPTSGEASDSDSSSSSSEEESDSSGDLPDLVAFGMGPVEANDTHSISEELDGQQELRQILQESLARGKTFFGRFGFTEGALAVTGRSLCGECSTSIPKGSVRFSYHYDSKRPSRWLHAACAFNFWSRSNVEHQQTLRDQLQQLCNSEIPEVSVAAQSVLVSICTASSSSSSRT